MVWLTTILTVIALAILLAPIALLLLTVFVLAPLGHLVPRPAMVGRTTFTCPVSKRVVTAAFLSPGGADRPSDVISCSPFGEGPVACKKGCLELATTGWAASAMTPRFSLVADGVALRDVARRNGSTAGVTA